MATVPVSRTPLAVLLLGVLGVSWAAIFVRLADEAPALTIAAYRLLFAAGLLLLFVAVARARGKIAFPPRSSLPLLALSGVFLAGHFWSWFASLERTSVASSVVIVGLQPLLGALLAFAVLRERPARREYAGLAVAIAGLIVIAAFDLARGLEFFVGDLLALFAALLVAAYQTIRRKTRHEIDAIPYSAVVYTAAAVALWLAVLIVRPSLSGFGGDAWLVHRAACPHSPAHRAHVPQLGSRTPARRHRRTCDPWGTAARDALRHPRPRRDTTDRCPRGRAADRRWRRPRAQRLPPRRARRAASVSAVASGGVSIARRMAASCSPSCSAHAVR